MSTHPIQQEVRASYLECARRLSDVPISEASLRSISTDGAAHRYATIIEEYQALPGADGFQKCLEAGVGEGVLLLAFSRLFPKVQWHGVDIPHRHDRHQQAFQEIFGKLIPNIAPFDFNNLETQPLPFPDNSFDFISFSEVAEHLPPNTLLPVLTEFHRMLKPGGHVLVTSPNLTSLLNRLVLFAGVSPFHLPIPEYDLGFKTYPHIHLYTADEFSRLSAHAGLKTVRTHHLTYLTYAFFGDSALRNLVLRAYLAVEQTLGLVAPRLRDGWIVILRKEGK